MRSDDVRDRFSHGLRENRRRRAAWRQPEGPRRKDQPHRPHRPPRAQRLRAPNVDSPIRELDAEGNVLDALVGDIPDETREQLVRLHDLHVLGHPSQPLAPHQPLAGARAADTPSPTDAVLVEIAEVDAQVDQGSDQRRGLGQRLGLPPERILVWPLSWIGPHVVQPRFENTHGHKCRQVHAWLGVPMRMRLYHIRRASSLIQ